MNEAKLSYTIKALDPQGWDEMFTVRNEDPAEYFKRISALKKWLKENGYTPTSARGASSATNGNATNAADDAPLCQYHGPMKPSNYGGYFCPSKMGDGSYCKSKTDGPPAGSQVAQPAPMPQAQAVNHATNGTPPPLFDEGPPPDPPDNYYTES